MASSSIPYLYPHFYSFLDMERSKTSTTSTNTFSTHRKWLWSTAKIRTICLVPRRTCYVKGKPRKRRKPTRPIRASEAVWTRRFPAVRQAHRLRTDRNPALHRNGNFLPMAIWAQSFRYLVGIGKASKYAKKCKIYQKGHKNANFDIFFEVLGCWTSKNCQELAKNAILTSSLRILGCRASKTVKKCHFLHHFWGL